MALKINSNQSVNLPSIEDILKEQAKTFADDCERNSKHFGEPTEPVGNIEDSSQSGIEQVTSDNLSQLLSSSMFRELNSCSFNQLQQRIVNLTFENMTLKNEVERLTKELTARGIDIDC